MKSFDSTVIFSAGVLAAILFFGVAVGGEEGAGAAELEKLVKEFAYREKPKMSAEVVFKIEDYSIEGLKGLGLQIVLARYTAPEDGKEFHSQLFICRAGKLIPFAETVGGHGFMSGVVTDGRLYYSYSWGSGEHRSILGQLTLADGKPVILEKAVHDGEDYFVKKVGDTVEIEKGEYVKFGAWKAGQKIGTVSAKEAGFKVLDDGGKELEKFTGAATRLKDRAK